MSRHLESRRLSYRAVAPAALGELHALAVDAHVRRYLLDGIIVDEEWARDEIARSEALFASRGVGLWIADLGSERAIGFVGFRMYEDLGDEPQLLYAFVERVTGNGYATEAAGALVDRARGLGWRRVTSAVDAPNAASLRVLEKHGFVETHRVPGAFGDIVMLVCELV